MRREVPKPFDPFLINLNAKAEAKLDRIAAKASKKAGGGKFGRAYMIHLLIMDADPAKFAKRLANGGKKS